MKQTALQAAYILHRRPYRDSSVLVELLTRSEGRLAAIVRLGKKANSVRNAILQPFHPILVDYKARGELYSLGQVEPAGRMKRLTGDRLACGLYLNELLLQLTHRDDHHPEMFMTYETALGSIERDVDLHDCLRRFEIGLLNQLGYGLLLDYEADSNLPIQAEGRYRYQPDYGPIRAQENSPGSVQGETLICLSKGLSMEKTGRQEAKQLMQHVIAYHLGGRKLRSRELFR